jgi:probable rRNA maturation factor
LAKIDLTNKTDFEYKVDSLEILYEFVLKEEEADMNSSLSLTYVKSDEIRDLNKRFRGCDEVTDVLSFDSDIDFIPFLGDIIIDISTANKQKGPKTLQEELEVLFLHGLLHLLGYDHLADHQKIIMNNKENIYIEKLRSIPL